MESVRNCDFILFLKMIRDLSSFVIISTLTAIFSKTQQSHKRCCTESCMQQDEEEDQECDGWMTCPWT